MPNSKLKIKILTMEDLIKAGCYDMREAIQVCEKVFITYASREVILPDKVSVIFDQETQNRINCLPAALPYENVYGMKWVSVFPENPQKRNMSNLTAVILLSELESGYPVAFMEGSLCSNIRTACVGAIGAKYFARKDTTCIGFIGAGEQAKSHFLAMKEVFPNIKECRVASRTRRSELTFVEQMKKIHPDVKYVTANSNYEMSVRNMDIIVTAISGQEKILQAEWIKPGAYYCHVAGLEDDFGVARKADKIVCDNWETVKHRTQTISLMYKQGVLLDSDIYADLHEVVSGQKAGRENDDEFIYFNSVGMACVDIALGNWMYQKAKKLNVGNDITMKKKSMFDYPPSSI